MAKSGGSASEELRESENSEGMGTIVNSTCTTEKPAPDHREGIKEVTISKTRAGVTGLFQPRVTSATAVIH